MIEELRQSLGASTKAEYHDHALKVNIDRFGSRMKGSGLGAASAHILEIAKWLSFQL